MMEGQDMCEAPERLPSEYYVEHAGDVGDKDGYVVIAKPEEDIRS